MRLTPVLASLALTAQMVQAVTIGQIDTFEDGTTQNWVVNLLGMGTHPAPPVNQPNGGPGGAGDNFLLLTSFGGTGAGSRMSAINVAQWSGNYLAAGIGAISMDLRNLGNTDLTLRLLIADPMGGPPQNEAISQGVFLPVASGWMSVTIPISAGTMTAQSGNVVTALTNATELRIFHSPTAAFPGPPIAASLGVDNIQAIPGPAIPEPATGIMASAGLIALCITARRLLH
ncbi:MAG TPA: hypothetical protein VFL57_09970 [Bryobacteraceae bacterium]|nr:hypothetical protein [Bryobacteraceae bacterium]